MPALPVRLALHRICAALVLTACLALPGTAQGYGSHHVLILHSYHSGMTWVDNLERGIRDGLLQPPYENSIVHTEYMDTKRNHGQAFYDRLVRIYREKYHDVGLDLIMTTDNNAFDFLREHRDELFKDVPVIFGGVNDFADSSIAGMDDITGVAEVISFKETVGTILQQFPQTEQIFVVNDYLKTGRAWHANILRGQKAFEDRVRFVHNENLTAPELREKIQSLQPGTVLLLGVYFADRDGQYLTYEKFGTLIAENAPVPMYCMVRFNLRDTVIGGMVIAGYHHGRMMSDLGRRVLNGEKAGDIPVVKSGSNTFIFNWPGMEKYGVTHDMLPPDSLVINEPSSFYREYFLVVWTGVGVIAVLSLMVVFLSLTVVKLRRTRRDLAFSERKYRSIFDNATEGIFQTTLDGKLLSANKALAAMFGYDSPEEALASITNVRQDIYVDPAERERMLAKLSSDGRLIGLRTWMKGKDGRELWVHFNSRKIEAPDGSVVLEGSITDITKHKFAEDELVRMRKYLSNILDSMPSILVCVDQEGRVTLLNRRAEKYAGMTSDQAQGKDLAEIFPWLGQFADTVRASIRERGAQKISKNIRQDAGETRYEDITVFPLSDDVAEEAVVRIDDVSRNVQMERMMVQSEKMMSVGGLAAGMAHEINNPLAAVIGYAQNIRRRTSSELRKNRTVAEECGIAIEKVEEYMEKRDVLSMIEGISESGKRAAKIVSNMLEFSRKGESSGTGSHCVTDLMDKAVELAANVYDMQRDYDFSRIEVVREYEEGLPEALCDGNEIQQVFLNLLKNGAEAMAEKEFGDLVPHFILRAYRAGDKVMVEIEDNGPGMSEQVRRRVLEPFFTTKPVGKGTGLGLSVSYFIVTDLHGGSMEVRSEEGAWTRFIIGLPTA